MDDYHNDDFERMEEDTLPSDVDDEGNFEWNLVMGSKHGQLDRVMKAFEDAAAAKVEIPALVGAAAMVKATLNNQLEVMKHLVKLCNVNAKDEHGNTCLNMAAGLGRTDIASLLLENNAGVYETSDDDENNTALHLAAMGHHTEVMKLILDKDSNARYATNILGDLPLHCAARAHDETEAIELLLRDARDEYINTVNNDGETPMLAAARDRRLRIVEYLISKGALDIADAGINNSYMELFESDAYTRPAFDDDVEISEPF